MGSSPGWIWGLCLLGMLGAIGCGGGGGSERPDDPRLWTHDQLMEGASLSAAEPDNSIRVLTLAGSSYQMGYQHGALLSDEIDQYREELENDLTWYLAITMATAQGPEEEPGDLKYVDYTQANSLPSLIEECEGMVRAVDAFDLKECTAMASLLYLFEDMLPRVSGRSARTIGCSQFAVAGSASADGKLVHGRNMDWLAIEFVMNHPLVIVRRPNDGLAHASLMWPGMIGSLSGINEAGLVINVDEATCHPEHRDLVGTPPMQLAIQVLTQAHDLEEALAILEAAEHASCQLFLISHGPSRTAAVVEMSATAVAVRRMSGEGVVYTTNHYLDEGMFDKQVAPTALDDLTDSSVARYARFTERLIGTGMAPHPDLSPVATDYAYGRVDVPMAIDILRDPVDMRPDQGRFCFPCTHHDGGAWALGNNNPVQSFVYLPEDLRFWIATGWDEECGNALYNPYVGFDLADLLDGGPTPGLVPNYDPEYNSSYCAGSHPEP